MDRITQPVWNNTVVMLRRALQQLASPAHHYREDVAEIIALSAPDRAPSAQAEHPEA